MTQRYAYHCPDSLKDGVQILEADYSGKKRDVSNALNPWFSGRGGGIWTHDLLNPIQAR